MAIWSGLAHPEGQLTQSPYPSLLKLEVRSCPQPLTVSLYARDYRLRRPSPVSVEQSDPFSQLPYHHLAPVADAPDILDAGHSPPQPAGEGRKVLTSLCSLKIAFIVRKIPQWGEARG